MPLRDHFRPPISKKSSWEGFHGGWPMKIIDQLLPVLPEGYVAEPRVHLGSVYELDVNAYEDHEPDVDRDLIGDGGTATMTVSPPTLTLDADLADDYAYEVLVFDESRNRTLVAAIDLVSPGNKDRAESRSAFVAKCAALIRKRVCVVIVDLVTNRHFNLYADLLDQFGKVDPSFDPAPSTYASTIRPKPPKSMDLWAYPLIVGQPLPTLPLWLDDNLSIPLELDASYEATCRALRIPGSASIS